MPITLQFDHPHFPDDKEFGFDGIGRIKNHGTLEVDDDRAAAFKASHGISIEAAFKHNTMFTINGVKGSPRTKTDTPETETKTEQPVTPAFLTGVNTQAPNAGTQQGESGDNNV